MQEMHRFWDTLHPPKFAVSNCLNCYFFAKSFFLVIQLPMLPALRPRLPASLLMWTRHEQKPSQKRPEGQE